MRRIITGGTGLIGQRLVKHWLQQQHTITVIGRNKEKIAKIFGDIVNSLTWDNLCSDDFEDAELVVNLAGASVGAKRWNEAYKKEILSSRVDSTKKITTLMLDCKNKPRLFNPSAVSIYGFQTQLPDGLPPKQTEDSPIAWNNPKDFLELVAQEWEKAAEPAVQKGLSVVFTRFAVVLAQEDGALPQIVKPFRFFVGGPVGTGNQAFSWVTIDDVVQAIDFLISKPDVTGPFNVVSPSCVQERYLAQTIANVLGRPDLMKMPGFVLKQLLGKEMSEELLLEGQHAYPKKLLEMGFQFKYPQIESALRHLLQ